MSKRKDYRLAAQLFIRFCRLGNQPKLAAIPLTPLKRGPDGIRILPSAKGPGAE
jgi:hypothetical protein